MTSPFTQRISDAMPPDDEMVIGTVVSGNPLTVSARGGTIEDVGRLSSAAYDTGQPVALIRQDSTWLALGSVIGSTGSGLALTNIQQVMCNALLGLTAAEQDVPGTTITFTTTSPNATVVALWFGDYEVIAAATAVGTTMLRIDGVTFVTPAAIFQDVTTGNRGTVGQVDIRTVTPGTHTALLRANRVGGADGQLRLNAQHTTLLLAVFQ